MNGALGALDEACSQVLRLRAHLKRKGSPQVQSNEERQHAKSTALAWFRGVASSVSEFAGHDDLSIVNGLYRELMGYSDHGTSRKKYDTLLKSLGSELASLRRDIVSGVLVKAPETSTDEPPDFSAFTSDVRMQAILSARWIECVKCISVGAHLAATVMMGGMLESLLVARANKVPDKSKLFKSPHVPVDRKTNKALPMGEWTLKVYIDVALDQGWITPSAKDVGEVIRDYRNYIHPHKEYSHNVTLSDADSRMFWEITKLMARQLL